MDELSVYTDAGRVPAPISTPQPGLLLELLLSDVATDVEVVTRELGLRDEMLERLRRALDRIECAQSALQAISRRMRGGIDVTAGDADVKAAVELLAMRWSKDYPADAVEWMLLR